VLGVLLFASATGLEIFDEGICDIGAVIVGDPRGSVLYLLHQSVEIIARGRDAYDSYGGAVPQFRSVEFGDRDVESGAQAIFQAADDLAAVFDRLGGFDVEFEGEERDGHKVVSGQWSVASHKNR
jgi:hypothetical protein